MSGSPLMAACGGIAGQRERAVGHGIVMPEPRPFVLCRMAKLLEPRAGPVDQRVVSFFAQPQNTSSGLPALPESDCDEKDEAGAHRKKPEEGTRSRLGTRRPDTQAPEIAGDVMRQEQSNRRALDREAPRVISGTSNHTGLPYAAARAVPTEAFTPGQSRGLPSLRRA